MPTNHQPTASPEGTDRRRFRFAQLIPLAVIASLVLVVYATGWHRELTLETLVKHRAAIDGFIATHKSAATVAFIGLYIAVAALSIPAGALLTISGGFLFGTLLGALAAIVGATLGATILFLIARSAVGEHLLRRAGPFAARFAEGFRADAFSYLLFLRLVPVPFWLVNLVPALFGVPLKTYVAATVLGIIPATFIFAFFGEGLDSVIVAQQATYEACLAAGGADCRISFDPNSVLTPTLLAGLIGLGLLALIPVVVKRLWWRGESAKPEIGNS
jgi:uncharacterized membrane protein YdjX (TVP38/TMEM64 family)